MDSDFPHWPDGLDTPLIERKHTILPRSQVTRMESGRSRVRRMHVESIEVIEVTWNFVEDAYTVFRNFFINNLEQGSLSFAMETLERHPIPTFVLHVTRIYAFLDGTYSYSHSDNLFTVTATLEVIDVTDLIFDPPIHVGPTITEGATSSVTSQDGEILPPIEYSLTGAGFLSGVHLFAVIPTPDQSEAASSSSTFLSGIFAPVSTSTTQGDAATDSTTFLSGVYTLVVIVVPDQSDTGAESSTFLSGVYTQTVVSAPSQSESSSSAATFLSGAYILA